MNDRLEDLLWQHEANVEIDKNELIRELVVERQLQNLDHKQLIEGLREKYGSVYQDVLNDVEKVIVRPLNGTKERVQNLEHWNYK